MQRDTSMKAMRLAAVFLFLLLFGHPLCAVGEGWRLPPLPPAETYGDLLLDRVASRNQVKPVAFSHGVHRRKFTCRVCHSELGFQMEPGATEISEAANRKGAFCGACHDGKTSFALQGNCARCHGGRPGQEKRAELSGLPATRYGYGRDWVMARQEKLITPADSLNTPSTPIILDNVLTLEARWDFIPSSIFPHGTHTEQLDCNSCHPDPFTIQKKGTKDFTMEAMLNREFCGACHRNVAFPLHDCKRCHPQMSDGW